MSLMSLSYKMSILKKSIYDATFTTKEQVKHAAEKADVASTIGYTNLSPEDKDAWYEMLADNLFNKHNNCIPCFINIGFGKELIDHSSSLWKDKIPKKKHWKLIVKRMNFPDWQFNAIVFCHTKEEAICITKEFFGDFGELGFSYEDPAPKSEHKTPWIEINSKRSKIKSYSEYINSISTNEKEMEGKEI